MKAHIREALMPLYCQHTHYLLRALKTVTGNDPETINKFITNIPAWRDVATCHEIAINSVSKNITLETHQNKHGKEHEYTVHPKAKTVGRDTRVKLIWDLLAGKLAKNPTLIGIEMYEDLGAVTEITCPFCTEVYLALETTQFCQICDNNEQNRVWNGQGWIDDEETEYEEHECSQEWAWQATGCEHVLYDQEPPRWDDTTDKQDRDRYRTACLNYNTHDIEGGCDCEPDLVAAWKDYPNSRYLEHPTRTNDEILRFVDDWSDFIMFIIKSAENGKFYS